MIGERLRAKRLAHGIGLREAARRVGISPAYLSRIETDEEKSPPAEPVIRALAQLLNDDFDELMCLAGRIDVGIAEYVTSTPGLVAFLRDASERGFTGPDLLALISPT